MDNGLLVAGIIQPVHQRFEEADMLDIQIAMRKPGDPLPEIPVPRLPLRVQDRADVFIMPPAVPPAPPTVWRLAQPGVHEARLPGGNFTLSMDRFRRGCL